MGEEPNHITAKNPGALKNLYKSFIFSGPELREEWFANKHYSLCETVKVIKVRKFGTMNSF